MEIIGPHVMPTPEAIAETDRLGDEICELSAHLEAATARLLDLIREFDARNGWNNGFRSCAHWLAYRAGMDLGAARERVRTARALGSLPRLANGSRPGATGAGSSEKAGSAQISTVPEGTPISSSSAREPGSRTVMAEAASQAART